MFVPYQPTAAPAPQVAFDLNPKDSTELDIFYQWTTGPDGKTTLIATDDPSGGGKKNINITWDSPTGIAPKTLQATFSTTVTGQMINFSLPANTGKTGDYAVDPRLITVSLLNRLQKIVTYPTLPPASLSVTIQVQPYVPLDAMGYRVVTTPKKLKTALTVKLVPNVTNTNALPGVTEPPPPPAPPAKPSGQSQLAFSRVALADRLSRQRPVVDSHLTGSIGSALCKFRIFPSPLRESRLHCQPIRRSASAHASTVDRGPSAGPSELADGGDHGRHGPCKPGRNDRGPCKPGRSTRAFQASRNDSGAVDRREHSPGSGRRSVDGPTGEDQVPLPSVQAL